MDFTGRSSPQLQEIASPLTSFMKRNVMQKRRSPSTIALFILRNFRKLSESGLAPSECTSPFFNVRSDDTCCLTFLTFVFRMETQFSKRSPQKIGTNSNMQVMRENILIRKKKFDYYQQSPFQRPLFGQQNCQLRYRLFFLRIRLISLTHLIRTRFNFIAKMKSYEQGST